MSTQFDAPSRIPRGELRPAEPGRRAADPGELVAQVVHARREALLRAHRFRLRAEDLEDCFSQATLELLVQARGGRAFAGRAHIANALELRFLSRVHDRRRAISGRSPSQAALEDAVSLTGAHEQPIEVADLRFEPERLVIAREDLRRLGKLARGLSRDQRLVLASQIAEHEDCSAFCERHGWSREKYRKVAQRARARLREIVSQHDSAHGTAANIYSGDVASRPGGGSRSSTDRGRRGMGEPGNA